MFSLPLPPEFTGCERCRDAAETHKIVTGTIPLTGALGDHLGAKKIENLSPDEVVPYLRKELHWRIQDVRLYLLLQFIPIRPHSHQL